MSLEQAATNEYPTVPDVNDKIAAAIDKLSSQLPLRARQQALPPKLAAAHRAILRTLAEEGRAPSNGELAPLVGADGVAAAIERLGGDDLVVLNADRTAVVGAYPMTTEDTAHHLRVNGRAVNAICALDAMVVGPMYDADVAIESRCHVTGEPVRIHQQGHQIHSAEPSDDVRVGVRWEQPGACAAHSMCLEMVFLKDGDTAHRWVEEGEGDKTEFTLDEAVAFGAGFFVPLVK
ncbi:alkylmercury lyase family protein [Halochromatium sp.]